MMFTNKYKKEKYMIIIKKRSNRNIIQIKPSSSSACTVLDGDKNTNLGVSPCINPKRNGITIKFNK